MTPESVRQRHEQLSATLRDDVAPWSDYCRCVRDSPSPATSSVTLGASPYSRGELGTLTYRAVDPMLAGAPEVTPTTPLVVGSVADAQNVDRTSPLGNIVSDMIRTRLV